MTKSLVNVVMYTAGSCGLIIGLALKGKFINTEPWLWVLVGIAALCMACGGWVSVIEHNEKVDEVFE